MSIVIVDFHFTVDSKNCCPKTTREMGYSLKEKGGKTA
jgi:hypothetical protein